VAYPRPVRLPWEGPVQRPAELPIDVTVPRRLLTSLTGALLATALLPSAATAAPVTVEAESLATGSGGTFAETAAAGGRALRIWSDGAASGTLSSRATRRISVRARAEPCDGAPRMRVSVAGDVVLDQTVSATTWTEYAADVSLADGAHALEVRFTNDFNRTGCDRNLLVDRVTATSVAARPLAGAALYVDPGSQAKRQADAWRSSRPADAALLDKIATRPQAFWFGGWEGDVGTAVDGVVTRAAAAGRVPALVAYAIPKRDCGGYSGGGAGNPDGYRAWIRAYAAGIGSRRAIVIVEPDALAGIDCLGATDRDTRYALLADAVRVLAALPNTAVYLDGGHDAWQPVATMADRLARAGAADAQGFALDVSNFRAGPGLIAYGRSIASALGVAHFVIDSSRNGLGPDPSGAWCNPSGRALGAAPAASTEHRLDWNLWIKRPGESDGACNGGPAAGAFWPEYALGLASRATG
jgi:endoglucanase